VAGRRSGSKAGQPRERGAQRSDKKAAEREKQAKIKKAREGKEGKNQKPDRSGRKPKTEGDKK
jgi:hypothetical protein